MTVQEQQQAQAAAQPPPKVLQLDVERDAHGLAAAMSCLSHALLTDDVGVYLSRPGREHAFHHAIFALYLASGPQMFLHVAEFGCCSLLGEVRRQQADGTPSSSDPSSGSSEQEAAAEAAMVAHAKKCRGPALERLKHQPMLDALVEEHGAAICVHFIGAHPERQGQGLGGVMLGHICCLADERGLHLYLEASTHRSKALYARHGFKHVQDKPLGDEEGAPVLKVMIRPPATLASGEGR